MRSVKSQSSRSLKKYPERAKQRAVQIRGALIDSARNNETIWDGEKIFRWPMVKKAPEYDSVGRCGLIYILLHVGHTFQRITCRGKENSCRRSPQHQRSREDAKIKIHLFGHTHPRCSNFQVCSNFEPIIRAMSTAAHNSDWSSSDQQLKPARFPRAPLGRISISPTATAHFFWNRFVSNNRKSKLLCPCGIFVVCRRGPRLWPTPIGNAADLGSPWAELGCEATAWLRFL